MKSVLLACGAAVLGACSASLDPELQDIDRAYVADSGTLAL